MVGEALAVVAVEGSRRADTPVSPLHATRAMINITPQSYGIQTDLETDFFLFEASRRPSGKCNFRPESSVEIAPAEIRGSRSGGTPAGVVGGQTRLPATDGGKNSRRKFSAATRRTEGFPLFSFCLVPAGFLGEIDFAALRYLVLYFSTGFSSTSVDWIVARIYSRKFLSRLNISRYEFLPVLLEVVSSTWVCRE